MKKIFLYFSPSLVVVHLVPLEVAEVILKVVVVVVVAVRYCKDNEPSTNELLFFLVV